MRVKYTSQARVELYPRVIGIVLGMIEAYTGSYKGIARLRSDSQESHIIIQHFAFGK